MEQIKELGQQINEPIGFNTQTDFVSRSQNPVPLNDTSFHTPSHVNNHDVSTTVQPTLISYLTDKLPDAKGSHDRYYNINFDEDMPCLSVEETRKNIKSVLKESDVHSTQSYQKTLIIPGQCLPLVQDKTKSPAKAVPSSSVHKSHRSLPHRACLVHFEEQYHLDHNLLSQPRATKYLAKVRTEISPGRYMAKLELHYSR